MSDTGILADINALRGLPAYQSAEALRRSTPGGASVMARAADGSDALQAVSLLISTWDTIAVKASAMNNKDRAFATLPVSHMYRELKGAIDTLAARGVSADNFRQLADQYRDWLKSKKKSGQYQSAAEGGLHARFG